MIFAGMSGSAIADAAGTGRIIIDMMTKGGRYTGSYAGAITAASARSSGRSFRPRSRWCCSRSCRTPRSATCSWAASSPAVLMGIAQMIINSDHGAPPQLPGRAADPAARVAAHHDRGVPRADDAGHPAGRHLRRRHDADRGRRRRRRLRLRRLGHALSQRHAARRLRRAADQRAVDGVDRHADRRRPGVQLRHHRREHSRHRCATS